MEFIDREDKYVLRLWDMFDGWLDIEDNLTREKADKLWNKKTNNGTKNTNYDDGDYWCIFPSDTKMLITPERLGR